MARRPCLLTLVAFAGAALACGGEHWVVVDFGDFGPGIATVSGRIDDPHGLRTPDMLLALNRQTERGSISGIHIRLAADGSFTTPPLPSGPYAFELIRTPNSPTHPATSMGVGWVEVGGTDVNGVVVRVRRDMELQGRYRIASDRADPRWPASIHVLAPLVLDGIRWWSSTQVTHGAEGGRFVLRNAYGPRVLRIGYTPVAGGPAAPARVLLDGRDITDVPTDFSEHESSNLEVVITERPPRLVGMVTYGAGQPAPGVLVVMFAADPQKRLEWSSTSHVARTSDAGLFSIAALPGSYLVQAVPGETDAQAALRGIPGMGPGAVPVELVEGQRQRIVLTAPRPP